MVYWCSWPNISACHVEDHWFKSRIHRHHISLNKYNNNMTDNEIIVNEINKRNKEKHGEIQECCNSFLDFCRCKELKELDNKIEESN